MRKVDEVESNTDQEPAKNHPDGTRCQMPPINKVGQTEGKACEGGDDQCQPHVGRWFPEKPYERWSLVLGALTLAAVTWYACIANEQWSELVTANRQSREALTSVQRAFVFMTGFSIVRVSDSSRQDRWEFSPQWENS